jgi:hypothetical protein
VGFTFLIETKLKYDVQGKTQKRSAVRAKAQYFETYLEPLFERTPPLTSDDIERFFLEGRMVHETHFHYMVRVQIVGGQIFVSEDTDLHRDVRGRLNRVVESLHNALTAYDLPDADFALQVGDGAPWELLPFKTKGEGLEISVPFFAQDKPRSVNAILIPPRGCLDPDYSAIDWCFSNSEVARASRIRRAVWRGSTTGGNYAADSWQREARTKVVKLSRKRPDLLDASFVHIKPTNDVFKRMLAEGLNGPSMATSEQREYAVIIVVDGNTVPDRLASQLLSGPAVVRQESFHHEYWYDDMKPWVHYIPVREDLADLEETLEKALTDEAMLANVSAAARSFVLKHLSPANIRGYWNDVLTLYSKHMRGTIRPAKGSRLVNPPHCLEENCLETHRHQTFGFSQPHDAHCNPPLDYHMSSYRHRCSRWTGESATKDLSCMLYNVSIICANCDLAGMCNQPCNTGKRGMTVACAGLCVQWLHSSSSRVEKIDSIRGWGNILVAAPESSSSSCDVTLSIPVIALAGNGLQYRLDRVSYLLFSLYSVVEHFGLGTEFQLLFTDVGSVRELGALAPAVLAMGDRAPVFLPHLIKQKLCIGKLVIGVAHQEDKAASHTSMLARGRNLFLSRAGFFVSNRLSTQLIVNYSISASAGNARKHEVGFIGGPFLENGVHLANFFHSLEHRGLDAIFLPDRAPVAETLRALRTLSCIVGTTDTLFYMIFAPRVLGVVELLSSLVDMPESGRALAAQMGRKLVRVLLGSKDSHRGSPLILPSFKTGQAIRQVLESDPATSSEDSVFREVLMQQLPCGNPPEPPCVIGGRTLVCTSLAPHVVLSVELQPPPREGCFGGDLSWGTCHRGEFLCDYLPSRSVLS